MPKVDVFAPSERQLPAAPGEARPFGELVRERGETPHRLRACILMGYAAEAALAFALIASYRPAPLTLAGAGLLFVLLGLLLVSAMRLVERFFS